MNGTKTYVYGLLDDNDIVCYIGKSYKPLERLRNHKLIKGYNRCKILDFFYDTEIQWIEKYLNEGVELENYHTFPSDEEWKIGDILEIRKRKRTFTSEDDYITKSGKPVINNNTGEVYDSMSEAARQLNLKFSQIKSLIGNKDHYMNFKYSLDFFHEK